MTAPERIWLQDGGDFDAASEVTWCQHSIDDADTEYIRADLAAAQPAQGDYFEGLEEGIKIGRSEPQPISKSADLHDPRDEVIARLVEAATHLCDGIATMLPPLGQSDRVLSLRAALAAAKAMRTDG